jgi:hypothetical protein
MAQVEFNFGGASIPPLASLHVLKGNKCGPWSAKFTMGLFVDMDALILKEER